MCRNDFFDPILSHSHDLISIPIGVYKNIPIPSRSYILISIPIPTIGIRSFEVVMIT